MALDRVEQGRCSFSVHGGWALQEYRRDAEVAQVGYWCPGGEKESALMGH